MHKLPSLTSRKVIKILERKGFVLDRAKEAIVYTIIRRVKKDSLSLIIGKIYQKVL